MKKKNIKHRNFEIFTHSCYDAKRAVILIAIICLTAYLCNAQSETKININLLLDYSAAEQSIALIQNQPVNTGLLADLRGNRIVASTTGLIANNLSVHNSFEAYLDSLKYRQIIQNDIYQLERARRNIVPIKQLLEEIKRKNFNRRVVATVEQIFPQDAALTMTIPVYFVVFGHENVDAYVRRIIWNNDIPQFVSENEGELSIIVNLAHAVDYAPELEERFITLLGVVAHEVFHAAFDAYKSGSNSWQRYYSDHQRPIDILFDLVQNEGIAYYLSLDQFGRGFLPSGWYNKIRESFKTFNSNALELISPNLSPYRKSEIIRSANLSGYWESYGSITGMFIAREIDQRRGRKALIETISLNPNEFLKIYLQLMREDSNLPRIEKRVINEIYRE